MLVAFAGNLFWFMFAAMIRKISVLVAPTLLLICSFAVRAAPQTMRFDYYHTGNSKQEMFSIDHVVIDPLPLPGDMSKTIDETNLGKYFFEVRDQTSKPVLYPQTFASVLRESQTTHEPTPPMRTFSESLG